MRIDFGQALAGFGGEPIKDSGDGEPILLKNVCINALMADMDTDRTATGEQKVGRWHLAQRVFAAAEPLDLKAEEVALIKDRVGKAFGVIIVAPAYALLDASG